MSKLIPPRRLAVVLVALAAAGFALTLVIFYPGIMTHDARYVRDELESGHFGDWQSPAMGMLWRLIDPIAPGSGSLFLLVALLYWSGFLLASLAVLRTAPRLAPTLPILALLPSAFVFVGVIWRDVLLASFWLFAATLAFATAERTRWVRWVAQAVALGCVVFGFLLRPNALFAAPILASYVLWPRRFAWMRAAILGLPMAIGLYAAMQLVYYDLLGATHQHAVQSIMVFDLGGISHYAGENQFPGSWTAQESTDIVESCYRPTEWDIYWWRLPCSFVMSRLEGEHIFGTPDLTAAWKHAVVHHPLAYLHHRAALMANFLFGANFTLWTADIREPGKTVFADRPAFIALTAVHDLVKPTPLFRAGTWLLLDAVIVVLAWRRRSTPQGAFAVAVGLSAVVYVLTYFCVGVASDFRYVYWAVLAALSGGTAAASARLSGHAPAAETRAVVALEEHPPSA